MLTNLSSLKKGETFLGIFRGNKKDEWKKRFEMEEKKRK